MDFTTERWERSGVSLDAVSEKLSIDSEFPLNHSKEIPYFQIYILYDGTPYTMYYFCIYKLVVDTKGLSSQVSCNHFVVQMYYFGRCIYFCSFKWKKLKCNNFYKSEKYEN